MGANGKSVCHGHGDDAWLSKCPCPSATATELTRGAAYALAAGSRCGCLSEMTFRSVWSICEDIRPFDQNVFRQKLSGLILREALGRDLDLALWFCDASRSRRCQSRSVWTLRRAEVGPITHLFGRFLHFVAFDCVCVANISDSAFVVSAAQPAPAKPRVR